MSDELKTDFTSDERNTVISLLRDEFGYDCELTDEHVLLTCQDLWRKGCNHLKYTCYLNHCKKCGMDDWEKRHPEYKDDALAKRLEELRDELRNEERVEIEKSLLAKGYVKVQWKQWNDGEMLKSGVRLYLPGSKDLKANIADAIENWKNMCGAQNLKLDVIDLFAKSGMILKLSVKDGNEYEVWEIVK